MGVAFHSSTRAGCVHCICESADQSARQDRVLMRRSFFTPIVAALAFAAGWLNTTIALAQEWPSRPVKIIVPFAAGGPADIYARYIGQRLQEAIGQPFVVDDRPGGGSVVGTDVCAKSPAGG